MKACSPTRPLPEKDGLLLLLADFRRAHVLLLENTVEVNFSLSLKRYGRPKDTVFPKLRSEDPLGANAANELSYSAGEACLCGDCLLGSSHGHMTRAGRQAGEGSTEAPPCG